MWCSHFYCFSCVWLFSSRQQPIALRPYLRNCSTVPKADDGLAQEAVIRPDPVPGEYPIPAKDGEPVVLNEKVVQIVSLVKSLTLVETVQLIDKLKVSLILYDALYTCEHREIKSTQLAGLLQGSGAIAFFLRCSAPCTSKYKHLWLRAGFELPRSHLPSPKLFIFSKLMRRKGKFMIFLLMG